MNLFSKSHLAGFHKECKKGCIKCAKMEFATRIERVRKINGFLKCNKCWEKEWKKIHKIKSCVSTC